VLFGGFADKATVNLCRDAHHESAGVGTFRQRRGNWFARCGQVGEHVAYDIGEACERFCRSRKDLLDELADVIITAAVVMNDSSVT
jgi:hypothetical protein